MLSLVRTAEVWDNGGLLAGPTSPGSFSPVLWRCLIGTSSHCMLPSLVFSMFISLARHLCTLPHALCSFFSVRGKHNMTISKGARHVSISLLVRNHGLFLCESQRASPSEDWSVVFPLSF